MFKGKKASKLYSVPKLAPCEPEPKPIIIVEEPNFIDDVAEPEPIKMAGPIKMA